MQITPINSRNIFNNNIRKQSFKSVAFKGIDRVANNYPVSLKYLLFKDKLTGIISNVIATFTRQDCWNESLIIKKDLQTLAQGVIKPNYLSNYNPEYLKYGYLKDVKDLGSCVYIDMMESFEQGAGTLFHKAVVLRSKDFGHKGRVALTSAWSSTPFHYICGFREIASNGKTARIPKIEEIIQECQKNHTRIDENLGSYDMYLTEEMAQKLLDKPL